MKSALLLIALAFCAPAFVKAQSDASTPARDWPKKVKLLQETRLDIQLGTVKANRKVPPNTEVDVLQVNLPNLVIRQHNATATIPADTTDFFEKSQNIADNKEVATTSPDPEEKPEESTLAPAKKIENSEIQSENNLLSHKGTLKNSEF
jgi:hypothetical protein